MIKKYYYPFICLVFLFLFINLGNLQVNAGIFDDEQDLEKVLKKLDKSELHLEQLINEMRQTNSILKNDLVGSIASSYEKYLKKNVTYINKINSRLLDLEGYLKNEIAAEFARKRSDNQQLKSNLDGQFNQLTDELAKDLEKLEKATQKSFLAFSNKNTGSLQKIVKGLNQQNLALENTNSVLKSQMMPTIFEQNIGECIEPLKKP